MPVKACPGDGWVISTQERERERERRKEVPLPRTGCVKQR